jgi:hypothetical protein
VWSIEMQGAVHVHGATGAGSSLAGARWSVVASASPLASAFELPFLPVLPLCLFGSTKLSCMVYAYAPNAMTSYDPPWSSVDTVIARPSRASAIPPVKEPIAAPGHDNERLPVAEANPTNVPFPVMVHSVPGYGRWKGKCMQSNKRTSHKKLLL